jgi:hypothetical protein
MVERTKGPGSEDARHRPSLKNKNTPLSPSYSTSLA